MAFRPRLSVLILICALSACSTASPPALDNRTAAAEKSIVAPPAAADAVDAAAVPDVAPAMGALPSIDAAASIEGEKPEEPAALDFISDTADLDDRFLRPLLPIEDAAEPLPEILPPGADVSYVVLDLARGTPIAQQHADRAHIPASSAKLTTAVAALRLLGPDHRFRTELRASGPIEDGVLKGDLILKGGGDPLLDIPDLLPLIDRLARLPLRRIEGRFLIDDTTLPQLTEIEPTQPMEAAYNPGLGALSIAFNRVNVRWENRRALAVETIPPLAEASFEGAAPKRLPPSGVQLKRLDGRKALWQLADSGARRSKRSLPVKDAGLHAGRVFADLAKLYGIDLPAPERISTPSNGRLLAFRDSRPLHELVRDMLWYSNNMMAELIGLSAAKTLEPELSSLRSSADLVLSELERQIPDVAWDSAHLDNHSGLSSKARLTPAQLAAILRSGWRDGLLSSLLPGSGWSGTLARRFDRPDQALRIWAKTGSINYVATLGGYLFSEAHRPAAFVIMISDARARAAYEAAPRRTRAGEKAARTWHRAAERAMDQIVERWLEPATARPADSLHASSDLDR